MAYKKDKRNTQAEQDEMEELVGKKLRDDGGVLQLRNATKLEDLVAHCQVVKNKKKGFINLLGTSTNEGGMFMDLMEKALAREGKRQWDPPHPSRYTKT